LDILYISSIYGCGYVAKESVSKVPLLGVIAQGTQTTFLDRTSKEKRSEVLKNITDRQHNLMEGKIYNKICIFPEGTNTNGKYLIQFKIGAFSGLTPVKPRVFINTKGLFHLTTGCVNIGLHMILTMCYLYHSTFEYELPVFYPNDYLYNNFAHLGKEKGEIFMEAMKEIMSEVSCLPKSNTNFQNKLDYLSEIKGKKIKNT